MSTKPQDEPDGDAPINPAMRRRIDTTHGTRFEGTDPMRTVSVKDPDEGRSWPVIWAIVAILCVAIAVYYVIS